MQALFARHRTYVYRWLLRLVSNETLAEDLLSEVFLDVWRQAGRFQCRSSVSTWLMSIARHKALSARRRRTEGAELDEKIEATIADPANDPEIALQEKADAIIACGVILKGKTDHARNLSRSVTDALQRIAVNQGVPVINVVLSFDSELQARERCLENRINRGTEAARAAVEIANVMSDLRGS